MNIVVREQVIYAFGPFRLDPVRHLLLREGVPVSLPPRLFDTLLYLVCHAGCVVEREELLRVVWRGRVVDDSNLKQTIFSLRRALQTGKADERFILTAPSRGYLFAAPVHLEPAAVAPPSAGAQTAARAGPRPALFRRHAGVSAIVLAAGALVLCWLRAAPRPPTAFAPPAHSLAVLAFSNPGGDPAQAYFGDGIAEELTATLSRIAALRVVARSSAFSFRGTQTSVGDIARQLNVGAVLEGSVRRTGQHVRISAELVDGTTGFTLWSRSYDSGAGDVLPMQADIAAAVAKSLQVARPESEAAKSMTGGTANPAAFDAYLHGVNRAESASGTDGARAALPAFEQAIALDPGFAQARVRRAHALLSIANSEATPDLAGVRRTLDEAIAEAGRAIAEAPDLGSAHLVRGAALMSVQDFAGADREITQAYALAPGDAIVVTDYALSQLQFGRIEAGLRAARQAAALDVLAPAAYLDLASALIVAQRYDEAAVALRHARILGGGTGAAVIERAMALDRGDYPRAAAACANARTWRDVMCLARAYHGLGRRAEAEAQLARLRGMLGDGGAYQYAEIAAQWGQTHQAVTWLQTAYRLHDTGLILMKSDALLAPIRATPEYWDVEHRLNFPG